MTTQQHDPACDTPMQLTPTFDQGGQINGTGCAVLCPADHTELQIGELSGCQVAGCPSCHGMLIQQPVFANLLMHLRARYQSDGIVPQPMDAAQLKTVRHCPACQSTFETYPYAGPGNAVIDACTGCGLIWLDAGELNKLVTAIGRR